MDILSAAEALKDVDLGVSQDADNAAVEAEQNENEAVSEAAINPNQESEKNETPKDGPEETSKDTKKTVVKRLESGGRILSLIKKAEQKKVAKRKIITFLKKKGVSEQKIVEAYEEYYKQEGLYEITFNERPLGFSVIMDTRGKNAIVSSIQDTNNKKLGMKVASRMYEVNGKRVDDLKHRDILKTISSQATPFYIVFREAKRNKKVLEKLEKEKQNEYKWQDEKDLNKNENEDDSDLESSYSSDDDAAHVAQHYKKKKNTNKKKKQGNQSLGLFKPNEINYWDENDVDKEQNEMLKELSRLMMGMAVSQQDENEPKVVHGMTHKRQKTLKKLLELEQQEEAVEKGQHEIHSRSMSITQNDINQLMGETEADENEDYDKEIFKCLNDLIATDDEPPMTPTTGQMVKEFFKGDDIDEYDEIEMNNDDNKTSENDKDEDILNSLTQGATLMKYGKFGKPKYKTFQLTKDHKSLVWFSKKKNIDDTTIPIKDIRKIAIGDESNDIKKKTKNQELHNASFTIFYGDESVKTKDLKKLTVTAKDDKVAFIWANGLKILADAARKGKKLSEIKSDQVQKPISKDNNNNSKHRKTNSVIISLDNLQKGSVTNLFGVKSSVNAQQLLKSHERTKANLNKCVDFVTSKRNWKAITAAGQFDALKETMDSLDKRLRDIHKSISTGDKSEYNGLKAELFSVNADIDALKQKLTAIVRKPKAL